MTFAQSHSSPEHQRQVLLYRYYTARALERQADLADRDFRDYLNSLRALGLSSAELRVFLGPECPAEVADEIRRALNGLSVSDWVAEQARQFQGFGT